ncbi:hypothetical protein AMECASPLE_008062, partial [Ameca splendens]
WHESLSVFAFVFEFAAHFSTFSREQAVIRSSPSLYTMSYCGEKRPQIGPARTICFMPDQMPY